MNCRLILVIVAFGLARCAPDYTVDKRDGFGPPEIKLRVSPTIGDSTTWFSFSAAHTRDADGLTGTLMYRWDLDNDGDWDTPYTINSDWVQVYPDPGFYQVRLEVKDRYEQTSVDSIGFESYGALQEMSRFKDPRDGQFYRTIRINNVIWMAENLNYGQVIPVTDSVSDNGIVEKYCYMNDSTSRGDPGGYYSYYDWIEIMNHDTSSIIGICPPGWELPNRFDWQSIIDYPGRPIGYFTVGGFSNLNLTTMGFPTRWHSWADFLPIAQQKNWFYYSRSFYNGYLYGPNKNIPYIISSEVNGVRGHIYTINYSSQAIREFRGIAPVRCIKRD